MAADEERRVRFEELADDSPSLVREFLAFLRHNKKYWLLPIVIGLLLLGLAILIGGSPAAPFLYPLW